MGFVLSSQELLELVETYHVPGEGEERSQHGGAASLPRKYDGHNLLCSVRFSSDHKNGEELDHVEHHHPPGAPQDVVQEVDNEDPNLRQKHCNVTDGTDP